MRPYVLLCIATCSLLITACGSQSKIGLSRPAGVRIFPAYSGPVCVLSYPLPAEIPAQPVGVVKVRRKGGEDPVDVLARGVREAGGTIIYLAARSRGAAWGHAYYVDPALKLDCLAAGGEPR